MKTIMEKESFGLNSQIRYRCNSISVWLQFGCFLAYLLVIKGADNSCWSATSPRALWWDRDIFHTQGSAPEVPQMKSWAEFDQGKHFYVAIVKVRLWTSTCVKLCVPHTVTLQSFSHTPTPIHVGAVSPSGASWLCSSSLLSNSFCNEKEQVVQGNMSACTEHIHGRDIRKERNWSHPIPPEFGICARSFAVYCFSEPSQRYSNPMETWELGRVIPCDMHHAEWMCRWACFPQAGHSQPLRAAMDALQS